MPTDRFGSRSNLTSLCLAVAVALFPEISMAQDPEYDPVSEENLPSFHEALKARLSYPLAYTQSNAPSPKAWRQTALERVRSLVLPYNVSAAFALEVIDEIDRGSYVARRIAFNVTDESRVVALLLVPKGGGPFPAALMLHDHGSRFDIGKEKWIAPWYDEARLDASREWADKYFSGRYPGDELARRGYVVLATDALGWGDREGNGYQAQQALAANLFNLGSSLAGLMALEDVRAAAFLDSLPEVDAGRTAAVGFSMGAFRAWQVAALSPHVDAAVADGWMATHAGLMVPGNNQLRGQSAWYMTHPGLAKLMDYPDMASLAAPKPLLFFSGSDDPLFPQNAVAAAFDKMAEVWHAFGVGDALETRVWDGEGHVFTRPMQNMAFDWLDEVLGQ
ncbi:dienelactone hydrolase family protein [Salipiger profundus]|uniref:dienelactone hydrolase family protein n=1 Tax=Salipiger profundus TaxID=1229727 RepID=UPI0008ECCC21|nr:dienelactone hydrolase family protein [Salipiger profundus]SFD76117.1 Dienelactone hydrolase [Salipiger profundus]